MSTRLERRIVVKSSGTYAINSTLDRPGTIFTNRGASGTVTFTLPRPTAALIGWHYEFVTVAAQIMKVDSFAIDTLITDNDAVAKSLSTTARIGVRLEAVCDGTSWIATQASSIPAGAFAQTGTVTA